MGADKTIYSLSHWVILGNTQAYQDVQAGCFEQSDLVGDGQPSETRHSLGELHHLDDALGGEIAELVPQAEVQVDPVVWAGVLGEGEKTKNICQMFVVQY